MIERDSLREYAGRDWRVAERSTAAFFAARRRLHGDETLRISGYLWQHVKAIRPDWPDVASRAADLENHLRFRALIDRVNRAATGL